MKAASSKDHLCLTCVFTYPKCPAENVCFGDGTGNDNVIECQWYKPKKSDGWSEFS